MPNPEDLPDLLFTEVSRVLAEMSATEDLDQRKKQSEILKNLCDSVKIFLATAMEAMAGEMFEFEEDDDSDGGEVLPFP